MQHILQLIGVQHPLEPGVRTKLGMTPEEITNRVEHLMLAQVHAALAYYHANREEIEDDIAKEVAEADRLEREGLIIQDDTSLRR